MWNEKLWNRMNLKCCQQNLFTPLFNLFSQDRIGRARAEQSLLKLSSACVSVSFLYKHSNMETLSFYGGQVNRRVYIFDFHNVEFHFLFMLFCFFVGIAVNKGWKVLLWVQSVLNGSGKIAPEKIAPRKLPSGKLAPGKSPRRIGARKIAPRNIASPENCPIKFDQHWDSTSSVNSLVFDVD